MLGSQAPLLLYSRPSKSVPLQVWCSEACIQDLPCEQEAETVSEHEWVRTQVSTFQVAVMIDVVVTASWSAYYLHQACRRSVAGSLVPVF